MDPIQLIWDYTMPTQPTQKFEDINSTGQYNLNFAHRKLLGRSGKINLELSSHLCFER